MKLSVIIPVYNSFLTIGPLVNALKGELAAIDYEVVLVNDGSADASEKVCLELVEKEKNITFISLRKNVGEHNAVMCGLKHSKGDCAVIIDDDFQNPPSEIIKLLNELQKGYDVVYSKYLKKEHSLFRNLCSRLNGFFANMLMDKPKHLYLSSFKIIHRDIINEIVRYNGPFPYIDGLILRVTSNIGSVVVEHSARKVGKSHYNLRRLVSLYLNMFVNFSIKPLRVMIFTGFFLFLAGIVMLIAFIIERVENPDVPMGWTALATLIITFSGFQILFLGVMGEYMGKQYLDQNSTPQWTIKMIKTSGEDAGK